MKLDLAEFRKSFIEEAAEHLRTMEAGLLKLEKDAADAEVLNSVFRAAHSIKGAAGSLGFDRIAEFTHTLETVLDLMRQGKASVDQHTTTLLLQATDLVQKLLAEPEDDPELEAQIASLRAAIDSLGPQPDSKAVPAPQEKSPSHSHQRRRVRITLSPKLQFFQNGIDPLLLVRDLENLGHIEGIACDLDKVPLLNELDPEQCYLAWTIVIVTDAPNKDLLDVFIFVDDLCSISIAEHDTSPVERRTAAQGPKLTAERQPNEGSGTTLKVSTAKVDALIDLIGEIVIAQSMVKQLATSVAGKSWAALQDAVAALELNTLDLQERVMAIRMVPVETVFARFPRMVRDLAAAMSKQVSLEVSGQDTELDKSVVERLSDPLTHLLRNSLDHGIETPEERAAAGKPAQGTIFLSASHCAGGVVIELRDDGRGLNTAKIRAKAEATGLISPVDNLTDEQVHAYIFEPGFSTSSTVSDISGRGVGMDVVKRVIDGLNGSLSMTSTAGRGTTFRIKLPLTLAVMDGLSMRVGSQKFIVPLLSVVESLSPSPQQYKRIIGRGETVLIRGQVLPLIRLSDVFQIPNAIDDPTRGIVVIVETDSTPTGILVDALLDQSQVVLKSLETNYKRVEGILGATILGDGQVSLILDISALCRFSNRSPLRELPRSQQITSTQPLQEAAAL